MFDYIKNHISFDYGIVHGVMMDVITVRLMKRNMLSDRQLDISLGVKPESHQSY